MGKPKSCTYKSDFERCPIGAAECRSGKRACPWDRAEDRRRRALPLVRNPKTGLLRRIVGRRE